MKRGVALGLGRIWLVGLLLGPAVALADVEMTVMDLQGRTIMIELVSADDTTVTFRRKGDARQFTLPLDQLDAESKTRIMDEAKALPMVLPSIVPEVVIGKRRQKTDSYYMVRQTITCAVKLRNADQQVALPRLTARVLFFGQNQKTPDAHIVLSVQEFPVELKPGESSATELKAFSTSYDSDNKGVGNIGGYQYSGYLLVFLSENGEVLFHQTTDAGIRLALANQPDLLKSVANYSVGSGCNTKLQPTDRQLLPRPFLP